MTKQEISYYGEQDDVLRYEESILYEEKIRRLEDNVSSLRISRRILVSLLEQLQDSYWAENARLRKENAVLRRKLAAFARDALRSRGELIISHRESDK